MSDGTRLLKKIERVESSFSWRVTAPLRRVTILLAGKTQFDSARLAEVRSDDRLLQRRLEDLLNSRSWRLTAPYRSLANWLTGRRSVSDKHCVSAANHECSLPRNDRRDGMVIDIESIAAGRSLDMLVLECAETLWKRNALRELRALAWSLLESKSQRRLGALVMSKYLARCGHMHAAYGYLALYGFPNALHMVPYEAAIALLDQNGRHGRDFIHDSLNNDIGSASPHVHVGFAKALARYRFGSDALSIQRAITAETESSWQLSEPEREDCAWIEAVAGERAGSAEVPDCDVCFGVMDYKMLTPEGTSSNLGDYIQTIAAIVQLARNRNVTFTSNDARIAQAATFLQERMRADYSYEGAAATIGLVPMDRDFASGRHYGRDLWVIANGWFMHGDASAGYDFPFPEYIKPLFVSFHVNRTDLLTPHTVAYLRRFEPIGCRDRVTEQRLRDHGIAAFFTGCLTSTLMALGPLAEENRVSRGDPSVIAVDAPAHARGKRYPQPVEEWQVDRAFKAMPLGDALWRAIAQLARYQKAETVLTSRLHCYLPCRALGVKAHFYPRRTSDIRFTGLAPLTDMRLKQMASALLGTLETPLEQIVGGADCDAVFKEWSTRCYGVEVANDQSPSGAVRVSREEAEVDEIVARVCASRSCYGSESLDGAVELAFAVDRNLERQLATVIWSIRSTSSMPLNVTVLSRGLTSAFFETLTRQAPDLHISVYEMESVDHGSVHLLKHTTAATMDRLLLPQLCRHMQRLIYLDADILVLDDIAHLWDTDMGGYPLAARPTTSSVWRSGTGLLEMKCSKKSKADADKLREWAYESGRVHFPTFNAGVLVVSPSELCEAGCSSQTLGMVKAFGFHDQDALNFFCRGDFASIDMRWNFVPSQDFHPDPALVHWAGPDKPWERAATLYGAHYQETLENVSEWFDAV